MQKTLTSEFKNVSWSSGGRKWQVGFKARGKNYFFGAFIADPDDLEDMMQQEAKAAEEAERISVQLDGE